MTLMQQLAKKTRERRPAAATYTGPDKSSVNGNRPLTFPTPYHGGKRRWAEQILAAFGDERECVYVEPFSGSAAVLLANPRPFAREILCDTNPHISNVFRCLAWAPEATAFWADWPTMHQDLTARHTWLLRWAVDHVADIEADPDFHDPKAAGWWLWGKSNWIGSEFGIVRGYGASRADTERVKSAPYDPDRLPGMRGLETADDASRPWDLRPSLSDSQGVQTQRKTLPVVPDMADAPLPRSKPGKPPHHPGNEFPGQRELMPRPKAGGVNAQRTVLPVAPDGIPAVCKGVGGPTGQGVQAQRTTLPVASDKRPTAHRPSGVSAQVDKIPHVKELTAGRGVSAQRHGDILYGGGKGYQPPAPDAPVSPPDVPALTDGMRGSGVSTQRRTPLPCLPTAHDGMPAVSQGAPDAPPDKMPHIAQNGGGLGITAQREGIVDDGPPDATHGARGAIGRARQDRQAQAQAPRPTGPVPLTGDRLRPWFQALAERLYRVIILNRGWQAGLTPTVLQQTRTARKPPVRVLIDPPYKGVGKLYGMSETEADALAIASWRWAAEHGSREGWRIAYCCREGDFDDEALALGWTCSKANIAASHHDSTQEVVWFSPHCLRPGQRRQQEPGEQGRMFETGE